MGFAVAKRTIAQVSGRVQSRSPGGKNTSKTHKNQAKTYPTDAGNAGRIQAPADRENPCQPKGFGVDGAALTGYFHSFPEGRGQFQPTPTQRRALPTDPTSFTGLRADSTSSNCHEAHLSTESPSSS